MSVQEIKNTISKRVKEIDSFDVDKLYPEGPNVALWQNSTSEELKKFVDASLNMMQELARNIDVIDKVGAPIANGINNSVQGFFQHIQPLKPLARQQITNQHHNALNQLNTFNTFIRNSGLYGELLSVPDIDKKWTDLTSATSVAEKLLANSEKVSDTLQLIDEMLDSREKLKQSILDENNNFQALATKYKRKDALWLWLGVASALSVVALFYLLILDGISVLFGVSGSGVVNVDALNNISPGAAILRVSALSLPAYLTYFFLSRYTHVNDMYDIYSFKDSTIGNMKELGNLYSKELNEEIVRKSLDALLSPPKQSEKSSLNNKQLKEMISTLDDLSQITKKVAE